MDNKIGFNVNNGGKLELIQREYNGKVLIINSNNTLSDNEAFISAWDMVMLINYYRYVKSNNIQCDFINPNGSNN